MKLAVEISDAADLAPKDGAGACNPFVEVEFDGHKQRTPTKPADRSPYWNHTLLFDVRDPDPARLASLPPVDVSVHHDRSLHDHHAAAPTLSSAASAYPPPPSPLPPPTPSSSATRSRSAASSPASPATSPCASTSSLTTMLHLPPPPPSPVPVPVPANQQQQLPPEPVASATNGDPVRSVFATASEDPDQPAFPSGKPPESASNSAAAAAAESKGKTSHESRVFRSVPAASEQRRFTLHAVASPPPPPGQTVVMPRPAGPGPAPAPPGSAYGLVETKPPLPAKMGPRAAVAAAAKIASTYDMVEPMSYLYVSVVKARDLPTMDITGALDPYVEVKLGNFKGVTRHLEKNPNPVWRQVFSFSREHLQANQLEVVVKDKDVLKDDFVGRVVFDMSDVPQRVPPDSPLAPQWYRLADSSGEKLRHGEIMLAVWIGTQADEAFPDALHSDAHSVSLEGLASTRSKVYYSPKLIYLKVVAISAQDLVPADKGRPLAPCIVKIQLGGQTRRTRPQGSANPVWNEEFMFVAADPFDEPLVVTVEERVAAGRDEPVGRVIMPVAAPYVPRNDLAKSVEAKWFSLSRALTADEAAAEATSKGKSSFASKIHLRLSLETAYHVLDESTHYSSDLQPAAKKLRKGAIGILELGILVGADADGAEHGGARWNEQYTWEVFDLCTVVTVAVFDNCQLQAGGGGDAKDQRIGKVRVRLSTLETDRVYTHLYPLMALTPSGLKKTGELHLAVRFTCTAWANMLAMYGKPLLPKMHYTNPISVLQVDYLRFQAMQMVANRLGRAEPPLRREVVEYMLDVDSHMFSLRRSKANFYRVTSLFAGAVAAARWLDGICKWKNPLTTILVHVLFLILVCYPELILPTVFLYLFVIGAWNYRRRPRKPAHMDTVVSHAELAHPDELDEEFDTFPTSKPGDVVRMRYDRLRSVAGRVQTVVGDLATQGERAQSLLSWRDPRATAIFVVLSLLLALVLYVTPFQVVAVVPGLYLLRHPRFRSKQPSLPFNFYKRLPAKSDVML
ncbi:hypothetical protein GUJ93_ZPchr0458g22744 [Zizania palustris]|uniref:C2 domain-containing protein n=1 Tax=Zizania palustris TaxID=103762 RepID=A0A8J5R2F1_ZIZPA|nr:hypothetical protein GUJ93_ZPchr0458g22744 [Zizania palustris]